MFWVLWVEEGDLSLDSVFECVLWLQSIDNGVQEHIVFFHSSVVMRENTLELLAPSIIL